MAVGMLVVVVVVHTFTGGVGEFTGVSLCVRVQSSFVRGLDAVQLDYGGVDIIRGSF